MNPEQISLLFFIWLGSFWTDPTFSFGLFVRVGFVRRELLYCISARFRHALASCRFPASRASDLPLGECDFTAHAKLGNEIYIGVSSHQKDIWRVIVFFLFFAKKSYGIMQNFRFVTNRAPQRTGIDKNK